MISAQPVPADPGAGAPAHVAIIMDGNGRWAASRNLPRIAGHRAGAQALRRIIEAAIRHGVKWLTIYAFSSENWQRPQSEVVDLTGLLRHYLRHEVAELARQGVQLRFLGDHSRFEADIRAELDRAQALTSGNTRLCLNVALSYGARHEIVQAMRGLAQAVSDGALIPDAITETDVARALSTGDMPDPDLMIRTGGEQRLSNFLLWQSAYAELVFLDRLWPDFSADDFAQSLAEFTRRERRFGARPA